ncbi:hypothetical protein BJ322DRAFT_249511 [Thelephora terrestris]|uniref:Uncharacterized protein n=1 Tax=Thelephora terrestris TaxID=56493 RepID=A0A9P6L472_9AGAM|nr:hypothetical protein BJ322DRAFT_249511 [Thelephora terrestris]
MPMHISSTIDTGPDRIAAMFPITSSLSLSTHSDILGILQREQDRAVALLSSSPLLSSLFVSYANQAAATQSATPSTEAEERKALEHTISTLQEDIDKLKPENLKMTKNLEVATASLDAFRSQVASLKEVISQQQRDLDSLRADQSESKEKCKQLVKDLNVERDNFQSTTSDFAVERAELKETIVQQQLKISRLERQGSSSPSNGPPLTAVAEAIVNRKPVEPEDRRLALRGKSGREPKENTFLEVEKMGEEKSQGPLPPALRWAVGMNSDHPRVISQEERKSVWSDIRGSYSTEEDETSAPPSIINSPVPGGTFDACVINPFPRVDSPCGSGVLDPRTALTKKGDDIGILASPSVVVNPITSPRFPAPRGNLSLPHREQRPPLSPGSPYLSPTPEATLKASQKSTSKLLETPKDVAEQVLTASRCPLPPSFLSSAQLRVTIPAPSPAKVEPEKPFSLLERATELKPVTSGGGIGGGNERKVD